MDPSGRSEVRSYFGLDLLQASSRLDGSGGRWPIRDSEGSPSGFRWVGHCGEPKSQDSEGRSFLVRSVRAVLCVFLERGSLGPLVQPPGSPGTSLTRKGAASTAQPALLCALRASQCCSLKGLAEHFYRAWLQPTPPPPPRSQVNHPSGLTGVGLALWGESYPEPTVCPLLGRESAHSPSRA